MPQVFSLWVKFFLLNAHICVLFIIMNGSFFLHDKENVRLKCHMPSTTLHRVCLLLAVFSVLKSFFLQDLKPVSSLLCLLLQYADQATQLT